MRNISTSIKSALVAGLAAIALGVPVTPASAQSTTTQPPTTISMKCVGAADQKAALAFRVQAITSHLAALTLRREVALANGDLSRVAKIDVKITQAKAHLEKVKAKQVKLAARCL